MTSSVFYKFKSQKETSRVEFDGTGISVFELKRDIIIKSGLGDGTDFDLAIFHEDGKEEYDDDTAIIPRSTTVIARRTPAAKRGAGRAQRYMTGKMPVNAKNSSRKEQANKGKVATSGVTTMNSAMTEEQRMAAMFEAQNEQWSGQLDEMSKQTKIPHSGPKKSGEGGEPPFGYVCYRCGEKGHWIKECPTNDDPNFENKPRIKRTTGIPKSFLRTVEKPTATGDDGDGVKPPSGIMVDADGKFVIAVTDNKSWEKFQEKTKSSAAAQEAAALGDKELQERGLECSIDKRIFLDPMKTPCCEKTYCNDCITNALIESDFTCPNCLTEGVLIDDLKADDETTSKITAYLEEKNAAAKTEKDAAAKEQERSKSPSTKSEVASPAESTKANAKSASPSPPSSNNKSPPKTLATIKATSPKPATDVATNSKKRPAEELLENPKIPKGPKAMQQQEAQKQQTMMQQQMGMMNGANGFPTNMNMPFNPMMMPNGGAFPNMMGMNPMMMGGFGGGAMGGMNMPMNMMGMNMNMNMNPMMMMNAGMGFPNAGGFNNMGMMDGMGSAGQMNGMGGMMNGNGNGNGGAAHGFPNQQKTVFAEPLPNEEDNAYFRQPVNPHRYQGRQRRVRPSDWREV